MGIAKALPKLLRPRYGNAGIWISGEPVERCHPLVSVHKHHWGPRFAQPEFMQVGHGSGTFRVKQIPWLRGEGDEVALNLNPAGRLYEPK